MSTLLAQIEACLNSRPFEALSENPDDFGALTPGHFLIGAAINAVPEPTLLATVENLLTRWQLVQRMQRHFWDRWSQEYLHSLNHRPKWWKEDRSIQVGQLCLLRCEITPPTRWPLARIIHTHPGDDGYVRVVTVRTATSEFTRLVTCLVMLPSIESSENEPKETSSNGDKIAQTAPTHQLPESNRE